MARGFLLALGVMLALFFFLLGWLVSTPANAQMQIEQACGPRREVIDRLKAYYGESESWLGQTSEPAHFFSMSTGNGADGTNGN